MASRLKNNMYTPSEYHKIPGLEEELTLEYKEQYWNNNLSGSQIKSLFSSSEAKILWEEKLGLAKRHGPETWGGNIFKRLLRIGMTKEVVDIERIKWRKQLDQKLHWGNALEDAIITGYNKLRGLDMKTDKRTFVSMWDKRLSANFDGFEGDMESGVEVKNVGRYRAKWYAKGNTGAFEQRLEKSASYEISTLQATYQWQMVYYMWFFNWSHVRFLVLQDGCFAQDVIVERDMIKEDQMLAKIELFLEALDTRDPSKL